MSCSVQVRLQLDTPKTKALPESRECSASPVNFTIPYSPNSTTQDDSSGNSSYEEDVEESFVLQLAPPAAVARLRGRGSTSSRRHGVYSNHPSPCSSREGSPVARTKDIKSRLAKNEENRREMENLDKICTIGTGTFGRVVLCKDKNGDGTKFRALKFMNIAEIVETNQVEHVFNEKEVLEQIDHPFIIKMYWSCHDNRHLYMLFDYIPGGELFSYLRAMGYFSSTCSRFYAAEIVLALDYLHRRNIVYRDLKPENLLLDRDGHLVITDFGFAKKLTDRTWTLCGTPEYLAPEIIENKGHNKAVDWWALGVLIFEMHAGYPPFHGQTPSEIYDKVLDGKVKFPSYFDRVAKDLVRKMLCADRIMRLGNMKGGANDVKGHKWFRDTDWDAAFKRKLAPPIIPKVTHDGDPGNFDEYDEIDFDAVAEALEDELKVFENW